MSNINLEGSGAIYHRVSTDKQDADRQRESTKDWLARHTASVTPDHMYEDLGWARADADKRPAFQQLLRDADDGKVKWIVCDALDRFGTKNKHQLVAYLYRLQEAGCRLYTVNDKEWTSEDLLTLIEAGVEGEKSEGEGRSKSERVIDKARQKAKRGEWLGGRIPYGMEVVALRLIGGKLTEQWRWRMLGTDRRLKIDIISSSTREYVGKNNTPPKEVEEILQLRPTTEMDRIDAIKSIFNWFATESISGHAIARRLNEQGAPPPVYSNRWSHNAIEDILTNSTYIGRPGWNKSTKGTYSEWRQGRRHSKKPGQQARAHAKEDWIIPDQPLFDPLIDKNIWEIVQNKFATRSVTTRSPKSPRLWLSGLLFCATCGKPLYGRIEKRENKAVYLCSTYLMSSKPRNKCSCKINRIAHEELEGLILKWLDGAGVDLAMIGSERKGKRKFPDSFFDANERMIAAHSEMRLRLGLPDPPKVDVDAILNRFADVYDRELPQLEEQLKAIREEQRQAIRSLTRLPDDAVHAITATKKEISEQDQRIRALETATVDSGRQYMDALGEIAQTIKDWKAARDAMAYESVTRRKVETVRKVLSKMILSFKGTGLSRPTSVLVDWEFIPVGMSQVEANQSLPCDSLRFETQFLNHGVGSGCRSP